MIDSAGGPLPAVPAGCIVAAGKQRSFLRGLSCPRIGWGSRRPSGPRTGWGSRRGFRGFRSVLAALLAVLNAAACAPADAPRDPDARTWIRNMWTGPAVLPQTEERAFPARSMAVDAPRIMNRREARTALTNPLDETPGTIAEGKALYAAYCALCHGDEGAGDGDLARYYRRMPALTARHVLNYPDGFVYSIIREGGRNMPRFGDALSVDERWALVHYLRTLGSPEPEPQAVAR